LAESFGRLAVVLEDEREPTRLEFLALQSGVPYWALRMYLADEVERRRAVVESGDNPETTPRPHQDSI
jgi:hypothetical protein